MSNFRSVLDFLQNASKAVNHEEIYEQILAKASGGRLGELDLTSLEEASLGIGERNILRDLDMMDKFIYRGMDKKMLITSSSLAKQRDKGIGKGSLSGCREFEESFLMEELICIRPSMQWMVESGRKGLQIPNNTPLFRSLLAAVTGSRIKNMAGSSLALIGECLTAKSDMRYMFLKGYLTLMAYNLAVTSGVMTGKAKNVVVTAKSNIDANTKVAILMDYNVVIDTNHFTKEEKWFLAEMGSEYPLRQYGEANIYNNLYLEKDEVCFISEGIAFSEEEVAPAYGSPERMWNMLISIATKLEALDDLFAVVKDFRGLPGLLKRVYDLTDKDEFRVDYPKSRSIVSVVEEVLERRPTITKFSGFYATSKCLVSDLLLSRMMEMSIYNVLEEAGALGSFGVPEGTPANDRFFQSVLRNMGLRSEDEGDNYVLQEWRGVRGCSLVVSMAGKLVKMATSIASKIRAKRTDFLRPQLLYALPYSACKNTTWATIRGWKYNDFSFHDTNAQKRMYSRRTRAYCWVMGVSDEVPSVGLNAVGLLQCDNLKHAELEFLRMGSGQYDITLVRHGLSVDVSPRTDEYELTSNVFYQSSFPGTRCSIVFDDGGTSRLVLEDKIDLFVTETVPEVGTAGDKEVKSKVPKQITYGGSTRDKWNRVRGSVTEILNGGRDGDDDDQHQEEEVPLEGQNDGETETKKNDEKPPEGLESASVSKKFASKRWTPPGRLFDADGNDITDVVADHVNNSVGEGADAGDKKKRDGAEGGRPTKPREPSSVKVSDKGILPFRRTRMYNIVNGRHVPKKVELSGGGTADLIIDQDREIPNAASIRGHVVKTPGDGTCGVHAVVQDLWLYGFVDDGQKKEEYHAMLDATPSENWHQQEELASYVNWLNMGLVVIAPEERTVYRYGTKNSDHNVTVIREGGHYSTFVPDNNGGTNYWGFRESGGELDPAESIRMAEYVMGTLDNPGLSEEIRAKIEKIRKGEDDVRQHGYRPPQRKSSWGGAGQGSGGRNSYSSGWGKWRSGPMPNRGGRKPGRGPGRGW